MSTLRQHLRIGAPIAAAAAALSLCLYFLLSWQPNREARRGFEAKAASVSGMLAQTVRPTLEFDDSEAARQDLEVVRDEDSVVYVAVRAADKSLHAALKPQSVIEFPELLGEGFVTHDEGGIHHVVVPILSAGKRIGWLQAGFSLSQVQEAYAGTRLTSLLVSFLTLLAGIIVAIWVARSAASRMKILEEIALTARGLRSASSEILGACGEQAASATEQGAAIEETRRTMASLVEAAKRIADASQEVFRNADQTARTTITMSDAIKQLTNQAQKISDISEVIRSISDKSDLLALNASLEGTKAGEAGRGFALVAAEMRRLAESVMSAAREIKQLAAAIRASSDSSVHAADEGLSLATRTSGSAKEITLVTGQQTIATEQVTRSMDEVSQLLTRSADGTRSTERAAQALSRLADQLNQLTSQFDLQSLQQPSEVEKRA